jgi:hypothetical protein
METKMSDENNEVQTPPSVTINDIAFLVQIIEIVAQRGAFKAEELSTVGAVYDKVKAFIANATPAAQPTEGTDQ